MVYLSGLWVHTRLLTHSQYSSKPGVAEMKFFEVDMWVDGRITITVLAEDKADARVKANQHIEDHVGGVSHGTVDIEEVEDRL